MKLMKMDSYGTYKFLDEPLCGTRVPMAVVNILAPGMYALLKRLEWSASYNDGDDEPTCPICYRGEFTDATHLDDCSLHLLLSTIESWDQEKFSLTWSDFERVREILKVIEGER